jgi:hypothetical protein
MDLVSELCVERLYNTQKNHIKPVARFHAECVLGKQLVQQVRGRTTFPLYPTVNPEISCFWLSSTAGNEYEGEICLYLCFSYAHIK